MVEKGKNIIKAYLNLKIVLIKNNIKSQQRHTYGICKSWGCSPKVNYLLNLDKILGLVPSTKIKTEHLKKGTESRGQKKSTRHTTLERKLGFTLS